MKQRIFKGSFLVGISVWLSCLVLILGALYVQYNDEYSKELKNEAYIVGHAVEIGGKDYFQQLNVGEGHRITWIKGDGKVLWDTSAEQAEMENHKKRPEVLEALKSG